MNGEKSKSIDYKTTAKPKAVTDDGIPVFCAHDALFPKRDLIPNPQNPNHHPEEQIKLLADIIEKTGWRQPITISNQSGYITKGHGRLMAAELKGWTEVPVDFQNYSNRDEEYADLIADNRLAELSEVQEDAVAAILQTFDDPDMLALTGYDSDDLEKIMDSLNEEDEKEEEIEEPKQEPETLLTRAGDIWYLGTHQLRITEDDKAMDDVINEYVYSTGNLSCICIRDGNEYSYMELVSEWAAENNITEDIFRLRKSKMKRK